MKFARRTHGYLSLAFVIDVTILWKKNARARAHTHVHDYTERMVSLFDWDLFEANNVILDHGSLD